MERSDGPGSGRHAVHRAPRRSRDRDVDTAFAQQPRAGPGEDARRDRDHIIEHATPAVLRPAGSHQVFLGRFPPAPAVGAPGRRHMSEGPHAHPTGEQGKRA